MTMMKYYSRYSCIDLNNYVYLCHYQSDYMALLLQTTIDGNNELILVSKLSGDADPQRLVLRSSHFGEAVENQIHISRY